MPVGRANKRPVIVMSGYTAAGKTTHGQLLAEALDVPVFSASGLLRRLAGKRADGPWGDRWSPELDRVREQRNLDDEVDRYMIQVARYAPEGVLDGCFLPWTYPPADVVRVWIESDEPSRARKCQVSHLSTGLLTEEQAATIIRDKDRFSRETLRRSVGAEFELDPERFDIVLSNSDLIPEATAECAAAGIATFHPLVLASVRYVLGLETVRPSDERVVRVAQ
jgi:cytidylate kinase